MSRSTEQSMIMGKAYEYACLQTIHDKVSKIRPVTIEENSSFAVAKQCFECVTETVRQDMLKSAAAGIDVIIQMEPKIIEDGRDALTIFLQPDNIARTGDIRDVIIIRRDIKWEIGISVKHNHAALKHSRLSQHIDFGNEWFGLPCSNKYFSDVTPIFNLLTEMKQNGVAWSALPDKQESVYVPILDAFIDEFNRLFRQHNDKVTSGIIAYLLGSNGKDYYKLIHHNDHKTTVMPFNVCGTLNQSSKTSKPQISIPKIKLPTRIIELAYKPGSKTTIELTMDNGWAISFRIHSASTIVEPSLKFDIQLLGQPADMFYIDVEW